MKQDHVPLAKAITASTATAALFTLQHHADAAIIYSGPNQNLTAHESGSGGAMVGIPIAPGISAAIVASSGIGARARVVRTGTGAGAPIQGWLGDSQVSFFLKKLAAGAKISAALFPGHTRSAATLRIVNYNGYAAGNWVSNQPAFAAFELSNGDLGWIKLTETDTYGSVGKTTITAGEWAYDNTPGEAINAGQTSSVPEPGTTALLALAGVGAAFLRRKRESQQVLNA